MSAQFNYASLCFNGEGGPQDVDTAAKYFEIAARQGDPASQQMIARMYEYGRGVAKDPEQARHWYEAAAAQNYEAAMLSLGVAFVNGTLGVRDAVRGVEYLEKAAGAGDWSAAMRVGNIYLSGDGVPRSEAEAYKWFAIAKELGGEIATPAALEQKLSPAEVASERREVSQWKAEHFQGK